MEIALLSVFILFLQFKLKGTIFFLQASVKSLNDPNGRHATEKYSIIRELIWVFIG